MVIKIRNMDIAKYMLVRIKVCLIYEGRLWHSGLIILEQNSPQGEFYQCKGSQTWE